MAADPIGNPPTLDPPPTKPADGPGPRPVTAAAARPATAPAKPRLGDLLAGERRRVADTFSAERIISVLKTLAWVAPLTLLIWIWAEREQVATLENNTLPFKITSPDANRIAYLRPGQDSNLVVDLQGPRARVENVLQRLRGGEYPEGLVIQLDRNLPPNREHTLPTLSLIADLPIFRDNGISVARVAPARLDVVVEPMIELEARVAPPPSVTNLGPETAFDPPTVRVRGPASDVRAAEQAFAARQPPQPLTVYADLAGNDALRTPGRTTLNNVPLVLPDELDDPGERITLDRREVTAHLHVRAADEEWTMPSMTVRLDLPKGMDEYTVEYNNAIANVKLIGPKDVIEDLKRPDSEFKPYALLRVGREDLGGRRSRQVRFVDLPPGVRAVEQREVAFELVPRAGREG
jgi:hypothetical protein